MSLCLQRQLRFCYIVPQNLTLLHQLVLLRLHNLYSYYSSLIPNSNCYRKTVNFALTYKQDTGGIMEKLEV